MANSGNPDQIQHLSDLGLLCLPVILLGVSRLKKDVAFFIQKVLILFYFSTKAYIVGYNLIEVPHRHMFDGEIRKLLIRISLLYLEL